jgi:hypothetical protein
VLRLSIGAGFADGFHGAALSVAGDPAGRCADRPAPRCCRRPENQVVAALAGKTDLSGYHDHRHPCIGQPTHLVEHLAHQFRIQGRRRLYSSIEGHIQRFRLMVQNDMSGEHTVREHLTIIDAFRAHDAEAAMAAMNEHIEGIRSRTSGLTKFADSS